MVRERGYEGLGNRSGRWNHTAGSCKPMISYGTSPSSSSPFLVSLPVCFFFFTLYTIWTEGCPGASQCGALFISCYVQGERGFGPCTRSHWAIRSKLRESFSSSRSPCAFVYRLLKRKFGEVCVLQWYWARSTWLGPWVSVYSKAGLGTSCQHCWEWSKSCLSLLSLSVLESGPGTSPFPRLLGSAGRGCWVWRLGSWHGSREDVQV